MRHAPALAIALIIAAPTLLAGTADDPELTDAAGDAGAGFEALDILDAWWDTTGPRQVTLTLRVSDLTFVSPALNPHDGDAQRYIFELRTAGANQNGYSPNVVYLVRCFVDQVATPVNVQLYSYHSANPATSCIQNGAGTTINPRWSFDATFRIDPATSTVQWILREVQGQTLVDLDAGAQLGPFYLATWTDEWRSGLLGSPDGPATGAVQRDYADTTEVYTVETV